MLKNLNKNKFLKIFLSFLLVFFSMYKIMATYPLEKLKIANTHFFLLSNNKNLSELSSFDMQNIKIDFYNFDLESEFGKHINLHEKIKDFNALIDGHQKNKLQLAINGSIGAILLIIILSNIFKFVYDDVDLKDINHTVFFNILGVHAYIVLCTLGGVVFSSIFSFNKWITYIIFFVSEIFLLFKPDIFLTNLLKNSRTRL